MNIEERNNLAKVRYERAEELLKTARILIKEKDYKPSNYFTKNDMKMFRGMGRIREASDYDDFYIADKAECEKQVENAEHILKTVYKYLKDKGVYEWTLWKVFSRHTFATYAKKSGMEPGITKRIKKTKFWIIIVVKIKEAKF